MNYNRVVYARTGMPLGIPKKSTVLFFTYSSINEWLIMNLTRHMASYLTMDDEIKCSGVLLQ